MREVYQKWQELINAMLAASDKSSNADMDIFNTHAKAVNYAVSWFTTYHEIKR